MVDFKIYDVRLDSIKGLPKYIKTKVLTLAFNLHKDFF